MRIVDQVYSELRFLPDQIASEVLDFVRFLAARHFENERFREKTEPPPQEPSLEERLAPYRFPMDTCKMDRDELNAR